MGDWRAPSPPNSLISSDAATQERWESRGASELQEKSFTHACIQLPKGKNLPVTVTPKKFVDGLELTPPSPQVWAAGQRPLSVDQTRKRQSKLGELRALASAAGPDIRTRLTQLAAKVRTPQAGNVYRIDELIRTAKSW